MRTLTIRPDGEPPTLASRQVASRQVGPQVTDNPPPSAAPPRPQPVPESPSRNRRRSRSIRRSQPDAASAARATAVAAPPATTQSLQPPAPRCTCRYRKGAASGYSVQLSSQRSEAEAQASYRSLQAKFPDQLSDRSVMIRRVDLGAKGIYYRAMVGPFASSDEASPALLGAEGGGRPVPDPAELRTSAADLKFHWRLRRPSVSDLRSKSNTRIIRVASAQPGFGGRVRGNAELVANFASGAPGRLTPAARRRVSGRR